MIDSHVHDRDWEQVHKETISHCLWVALLAGLSGIIVEPNTSPGLTTTALVEKRLNEARYFQDKLKIGVAYFIEMGLTKSREQVRMAVQTYRTFFPKPGDIAGVVGFKQYTVDSGGGVFAETEAEQKGVIETLVQEGYEGPLSIHGEAKDFLKPNLWNPANPISHCYARPSEAEIVAFERWIGIAEQAGFKGTLIAKHVSTPKTLDIIDKARRRGIIKIATEVTPHHCLMYDEMMNGEYGILLKVNPPLRTKEEAREMFKAVKDGRIDFTGTDHAPHTLAEKTGALDAKGNPQYMSGFPGLPFYPYWSNFLKAEGVSDGRIREITHINIEKVYGIKVKESGCKPYLDLHSFYSVDVWKEIRERLAA